MEVHRVQGTHVWKTLTKRTLQDQIRNFWYGSMENGVLRGQGMSQWNHVYTR